MDISSIELNHLVGRLIESLGEDVEARSSLLEYALDKLAMAPSKIRIKVDWDNGPDGVSAHTQEAGTVSYSAPESSDPEVRSSADSINKKVGHYTLQLRDRALLIWPQIRGVRQGHHSKINLVPPYILGFSSETRQAEFFGIPNEVRQPGDEKKKGEFWLHSDGKGDIREEKIGTPAIQRNEPSGWRGLISRVTHPLAEPYLLGFRVVWCDEKDAAYKDTYHGIGYCYVTPPNSIRKSWTIESP